MSTPSRRPAPWAVLAAWLLAAPTLAAPFGPAPPASQPVEPVVGTELDELVAVVKPPARFAGHQPQFAVERQTVTFQSPRGPESKDVWVIKDGDRCVAVYSDRPQIDLITSDPAAAPKTIAWPARYHNATLLNTRITTVAYVDRWGVSGDTAGFGFTGGGASLTLTEWQRWTAAGPKARDGQTVARHTLRLDPVLGYVIDVEGELAFTAPPTVGQPPKGPKPLTAVEICNLLAARMSDIWPSAWRLDTTVYSQASLPSPAFRGWRSNLAAADLSDNKADMKLRPRGLVAFVDPDGWSPVIAHAGEAPVHLATCNVWQDQHNIITLATKPDTDGLYRTRYRYRFGYAPPELGKTLLARTTLDDFGGLTTVRLRFGRLEDFEDQPLPLTTVDRGGYATAFGSKSAIATDQARSGQRSLRIAAVPADRAGKGYDGFIFTPQFNLLANTTYRLECWVKVQGEDTKAFIRADLYEYTPHEPARTTAQQTNVASAGPDWQKLELEFTTPAWDPFMDLRLLVSGSGVAYFDDFQVTAKPPPKP